MIDKKTYDKIWARWMKVKKDAYQKWNRVKTRMPFFEKNYLEAFRDMDVLELGCNAGIYGYEISQVAKSYMGVDQGDWYIDQAKETQKFIKIPCTFMKSTVKSFIKAWQRGETPPFNMIFATFVLYHLSKKETDRLREFCLPKCEKVMIMTRTSKRSPWKKYNPHHFEKPGNVAKWLESAGFKTTIKWHESKKFAGILGVRDELSAIHDEH